MSRNNVMDFDDGGTSYGFGTGVPLVANQEQYRICADVFSNPDNHVEKVPWKCYSSAYGHCKDYVRRYLQSQYLLAPGIFQHGTDIRIKQAGLYDWSPEETGMIEGEAYSSTVLLVEMVPKLYPIDQAVESDFYLYPDAFKKIQYVWFGTLQGPIWIEDVTTRHLISPTLRYLLRTKTVLKFSSTVYGDNWRKILIKLCHGVEPRNVLTTIEMMDWDRSMLPAYHNDWASISIALFRRYPLPFTSKNDFKKLGVLMRSLERGTAVEKIFAIQENLCKWTRPIEMFNPKSEAFDSMLHNWKTVMWSLAMYLVDRELEFPKLESRTQIMLRRSMNPDKLPRILPLGCIIHLCLDGLFRESQAMVDPRPFWSTREREIPLEPNLYRMLVTDEWINRNKDESASHEYTGLRAILEEEENERIRNPPTRSGIHDHRLRDRKNVKYVESSSSVTSQEDEITESPQKRQRGPEQSPEQSPDKVKVPTKVPNPERVKICINN